MELEEEIKDFNGKLYGLVKFNGSKEHHNKIIEYFKERNLYIEYENDKWGNYISILGSCFV